MKRLELALIPLALLGISCNQQTDGGVYRSLDSGETWEQTTFISTDGKRVQSISDVDVTAMAFHPEDPNIIYVGTREQGLYISLTTAESWIQSKIDSGYIGAIAIDPVDPSNVYLAQDTKILKSTDEGATWEAVYSDVNGATITTLAVDSYEHSRIYAGTSVGDIYKSTDYGVNWDLRMQRGDGIKRLAIADHDTRIIYALTVSGTVYKSVTGGEPTDPNSADKINSGWANLLAKGFDADFQGGGSVEDIAIDQNDSSVLYLTTRRGLLKGTGDGSEWSDIVTLVGANDPQNDDIRNVWSAPGRPNELYFTLNNRIHKSVDAGVTWKVIENFPSNRKIYRMLIDPITPNVIYLGMFKVEEEGGLIKQPK